MTREEHELIDFDDFLPGIAVSLPDVPEALIFHKLKDTLVEFCTKSRYWVSPLPDILVYTGVTEYPLDGPTAASVIAVTDVWEEDGTPIPRLNEKTAPGDKCYWQDQPGYINFQGELNGQTLKLQGAVQPSEQKVARCIYDDFGEAIEQGTIGRLQMMPRKDWSDPAAAKPAMEYFRHQITKANTRAANGFSAAPPAYVRKPRKFF